MGLDRTGGCHAVLIPSHPHEAAVPHGQTDTGGDSCHPFQEKPNQKEQIRIKTESLKKYFPSHYSTQQMEKAILKYKLCGEQYYPCLLPPEPENTEEDLLDLIIQQMAMAQGIDEDLKERDPLAWVGAMNNIKSAAQEFFRGET